MFFFFLSLLHTSVSNLKVWSFDFKCASFSAAKCPKNLPEFLVTNAELHLPLVLLCLLDQRCLESNKNKDLQIIIESTTIHGIEK